MDKLDPPQIVLCNSANVPEKLQDIDRKPLTLEYRDDADNKRNISLGLPDFVRQAYHLPNRILDLLEIATYIFSADRLVSRGAKDAVEYHSWSRKFHFVVKVRDIDFWQQAEVKKTLTEALTFMSGDESYTFTFQGGHSTPRADLFDTDEFELSKKPETSTLLFSGGLDSLSGALKHLEQTSDDVCLVSYRSQSVMMRTQDQLVKAISKKYPDRLKHYTFRCNLSKTKAKEETQRTRSLLFTAIAFAISYVLKKEAFYVYENGITGLNFKKRQDQFNARTSRTTHPKVLSLLEKLFQLINEEHFSIENPFLFKTKTDVVKNIADLGYEKLIPSSVSCGKGRLNFEYGTHCGGCSQCVDRRFGVYASDTDKWDEASQLYDLDFINEPVTTHEAKTTLVDYIRQAHKFDSWNIEDFHDNTLQELVDIVDHVPAKNDQEAIEKLFKLCSKHGQQVASAIKKMRSKHDDPFEKINEDSLLDLLQNRPYLKTNGTIYDLIRNLRDLPSGNDHAKKYEKLGIEILQKLFNPYLIDPKSQVKTHDGREIIDITFQNTADNGFWKDMKERYGNIVVIFELKNMEDLSNEEFHQIAGRLNEKKGRMGFLVARSKDGLDNQRAYRKLQDDKIIITLTDKDLIDMANYLAKGKSPTKYVREMYREFIEQA